jgi:hypothetical protein
VSGPEDICPSGADAGATKFARDIQIFDERLMFLITFATRYAQANAPGLLLDQSIEATFQAFLCF